MEIIINSDKPEHISGVREMIKDTFNRPDEAALVDSFRKSGNLLMSVVAFDSVTRKIAGFAAVSPLTVETENGTSTGGRLTPVVVSRDYQGQGLGSRLIESITELAANENLPFILVMGNPNLYQKLGFEKSTDYNIKGPEDMSEDVYLLKKGPDFVKPEILTTARNCPDFDILDHKKTYEPLISQFRSLVEGNDNLISRMSTLAALLHNSMPLNSWTGFYLYDKGELIVGPFQGPVACLRLKKDTGVCWHAFNRGESVVVGNVHDFPGHIACDASTCSEVVVPCRNAAGEIYAVLDIDSHDYNAFNQDDATELEKLVELLK